MGRHIEITFYYGQPGGRVLASPPRQMRVPLPLGFPPPWEVDEQRTTPQSAPPDSRPPAEARRP
jgi:hypothetical protein